MIRTLITPKTVGGGLGAFALAASFGGLAVVSRGPARPGASESRPVATESVANLPVPLRQEGDCTRFGARGPQQNPHQSFYFTRGAYSSSPWSWRGRSWATDYPKADQQFVFVMQRTLDWDIYGCENPIRLDDPHLRRFPFLYVLEVGAMGLTDPEVEGLRNYLLSGGFLFVDDFWGPAEWENFEREITRVLPGHHLEEIPMDHLIFRIIYPIAEVLQVPNVQRGETGNPAYYGECYYGATCPATVRGIFDDDGRLMVVAAHNSDLGDAWEWAERPRYPFDRSNFAFSLAFNVIAYSMVY